MRFDARVYYTRLLLVACLFVAAVSSANDSPFVAPQDIHRDRGFFPADFENRSDLPSPSSFLGHALGERLTRNDQFNAYLQTLAARSNRMRYEVIGYSHERRPISNLIITAPENFDRLELIRNHQLALHGLAEDSSNSEDMPIVVGLNYGVHGNEVSSTDAALAVAYHFAASRGEAVETLLRNTVIVLNASLNPDGSSRQSAWNWSYSGQVPVTDPLSMGHREGWPNGRTNHYWFDLNRQWLLQQHPESRAVVDNFHYWRPAVLADYHEMGSEKTYYFHPGAPNRVFPLIPERSMTLLNQLVDGPRAFLDQESRLYFSDESYDNFYIGKGSTYPHMHGSLGVLFEQARSIGLRDTPWGVLSFRDNIRTQYRTSIALVEKAVAMRSSLQQFQRDFSRESRQLADKDRIRAYVVRVEDPGLRFHFLDLLGQHRIRSNALAKDISIAGERFLRSNSILIETRQPQYRMIKGLFDRITRFKDNTFYDVSAWTLPLAFNLSFAELRSGFSVGETLRAELPAARVPAGDARAWVMRWNHYYAPRALYRLLNAGLHPRVSSKAFSVSVDGRRHTLAAGSIIIPGGWQSGAPPSVLDDVLREIAQQDGIELIPVASSHTLTKGMDLGSPSSFALEKPRIALLTEGKIDPYTAGEIWHYLDHDMRIPVVLLQRSQLNRKHLAGFTHLLLADGNFKDFGDDEEKLLKRWTKDGGTLIAIRRAAKWAGKTLLELKTVAGADDKTERLAYGDKTDNEALDLIGGAIMAGELDTSHPLGYGYANRGISSLRNSLIAFEPPENPYATVIAVAENPLQSGYASAENQAMLAGKSSMVAERLGDGSVILFTDNPLFRAYFFGTKRLFANSIYFSRTFDNPKKAD